MSDILHQWNQGNRKYSPLKQPTAQQVMIEKTSAGPITVFVIGAHTNFAVFLMKNPHLKRNIEHIYVMGGGVRSNNPTGCCPKHGTPYCHPRQCGDPGNLFTDYNTNPYAEFNIFGDPFAAYQVLRTRLYPEPSRVFYIRVKPRISIAICRCCIQVYPLLLFLWMQQTPSL